jgi:hypothetical protein
MTDAGITVTQILSEKRRGQPAKHGRRVFVGIWFREGEHDEVLARLNQLPERQRSSYIRRVLAGAPVEVHQAAFEAESERVRAGLDALASAWGDEEETA